MSTSLGELLLTDSRLPSGGYASSAGLEPGLRAELDPEQIPAYIRARAQTVALVEASAAVLAHRAAKAVHANPTGLAAVHTALAARTPSEPLREVSGFLGRALLRMGQQLWPEDAAVLALAELGREPLRPVALGAVAAVLGLEETAVARAVFYDDAQTVAAATLKLAPIDPVTTVGWVLALQPLLDTLITAACAVTDVEEMPACTAPMAEQWSLDHANQTRRIFRA